MSPTRARTVDGTGFLLELSQTQQATRILINLCFLCFEVWSGLRRMSGSSAGPLQTPATTRHNKHKAWINCQSKVKARMTLWQSVFPSFGQAVILAEAERPVVDRRHALKHPNSKSWPHLTSKKWNYGSNPSSESPQRL